jgi:hypothetical protein
MVDSTTIAGIVISGAFVIAIAFIVATRYLRRTQDNITPKPSIKIRSDSVTSQTRVDPRTSRAQMHRSRSLKRDLKPDAIEEPVLGDKEMAMRLTL